MKQIKLLFSVLALAAVLFGCKKDDPGSQAEPFVEINPTTLSFDETASTKTINVKANRSWKLVTDAEWLAFEPASGVASDNSVSVKVIALANAKYNRQAEVSLDITFEHATLTVSQTGALGENTAGKPVGSGTKEDPFNVNAALAKTNALSSFASSDAMTEKNSLTAYVKGKISTISDVSTSYGNATYFISDDGTDAEQLEVYRGFYLGKANFTTADQIKVGDDVIVYGTLVNYGGKTPEFTTGNEIFEHNGNLAPDAKECTITDMIGLNDNTLVKTDGAYVLAAGTSNFVLSDLKTNILVYGPTAAAKLKVGDKVNVTSANKTTYNGVPELSNPEITIVSSDNTLPEVTPKDITASFATYKSSVVECITYKGVLSVVDSHYNVTVGTITTQLGSISGPLASFGLDKLDGKAIIVTGYLGGISEGDINYVNTVATNVEVDAAAKVFNASIVAPDVLATVTTDTIKVNSTVAWTASCDNADFTLDKTSGTEDATIVVSFAANTTTSAKVAKITIKTDEDVENKTITLTLTQGAAASASTFSSNVTWTLGANSYDEKATVNGIANVPILKVGKSSAEGDATIAVKKGVKKVSFYGVAWKDKAATVCIKVGDQVVYSQDLAANDGASNSSPYTLTVLPSDKYTFDITTVPGMSEGVPADMAVTVTTSSTNKRIILFGIKTE